MKKTEETLKTAMDRRLSFLDDLPSCRAAVLYRIAREEEPVMKKKISVGFVFAMVLVILSAAALAAGLLLSPRADAVRTADQALEKQFGITAEMQTFFGREEKNLEDGTIQVTWTGAGDTAYVLGTYTALVKDGKAEIAWSRNGEDVSGGYEADAWGIEQLKQMFADSTDEARKRAYLEKAAAIARAHNALEPDGPSETDEHYGEKREADKTTAMKARKLTEEEMIETGRTFIIETYGLNAEQSARLELYTNSFRNTENEWYEMVDGRPCFLVEYLLYETNSSGEITGRTEKDGYYRVYVNTENGTVEQYEYNSALGGEG